MQRRRLPSRLFNAFYSNIPATYSTTPQTRCDLARRLNTPADKGVSPGGELGKRPTGQSLMEGRTLVFGVSEDDALNLSRWAKALGRPLIGVLQRAMARRLNDEVKGPLQPGA